MKLRRKVAATLAAGAALAVGWGASPAWGQSGYQPTTEVQGAVETRGNTQTQSAGVLSFTGAESTETAILGLSAVVAGVALVYGARRELRRR